MRAKPAKPRSQQPTPTITFRLERELIPEMDAAAHEQQRNRSNYIRALVIEALAKRRAEQAREREARVAALLQGGGKEAVA